MLCLWQEIRNRHLEEFLFFKEVLDLSIMSQGSHFLLADCSYGGLKYYFLEERGEGNAFFVEVERLIFARKVKDKVITVYPLSQVPADLVQFAIPNA